MRTVVKKTILRTQEEKSRYSQLIRKIDSLKLNRFIKPCNYVLVRSNGLVRSYENIILDNDGKMSLMDIDHLIEELKLLRKDVLELSEQSIILEDLDTENIVVNDNKIYLHDFSKFRINTDINYTSDYNNIKLNEILGVKLIAKENDDISKSIIEEKLYSKFLASPNAFVEDYIKDNVKTKSLRMYFKRDK